MVVNQKPTGKAMSMAGGLAIAGLTSLALTLLCTGIIAKLMEGEMISERSVGYGVMVLLLFASFVSALIACWKIRRQRLAVCALSGTIYFLILLSITALFFGGQYSSIGETALLILCGSMLAAMAGSRENRRGKYRKFKVTAR